MKKHVLTALLLCLALCLPALAAADDAKPMMDIVWVVDCTGSMSSVLSNVRSNLASFAAQLTAFDVRYGLVGFGDEVNDVSPRESTVKIQWDGSDWTSDISVVKNSMVIGGKGGLPSYNGGDGPETSTIAITVAANQYTWRENALRQIILVTDVSPQPQQIKTFDDGTRVEVPHVIPTGDLCKSKNISVSVVDCYSATGYDEILSRTNGKKVGTSASQMELLAQWVHDTPVVITQPEDQYVHEDDNVLFMATSLYGKRIRFLWYRKRVDSDTETGVMGGYARSTEPRDNPQCALSHVSKRFNDGAVFYCRFINTGDGDTRSIETRRATLRVASKFAITQQPQPQFVDAGQTAAFTVAATGDGLTYQWQKQSGDAWVDLSGKTAATLSIPATLADDGSVYRCVIKDAISDKQPGGYTLTSDSAALTVAAAPAITGNPQDVTTEAGKTATFTVQATGTGLTYQWQQQANGSWVDLSGETGASLTVTATMENSGSSYRCQVTSSYGTVIESQPAVLTVQGAPAITEQPERVVVMEGEGARITVTATGEGLKYQWQVYRSGVWTDCADGQSPTLTLRNLTPADDGQAYRCVVTSSYGTTVTSNTVTLTVVAKVTLPQTGDSSRPWLWLTLICASLLGLTILRRRRAS